MGTKVHHDLELHGQNENAMTTIRILEILKRIKERIGTEVFVEIYAGGNGSVKWKEGTLFTFDRIQNINRAFIHWKNPGKARLL